MLTVHEGSRDDTKALMETIGRRARAAARPLSVATAERKRAALLGMAESILRGEQKSTIFKDTRELAKVTAGMVDAMLTGKTVPINDTKTYNNGVKVVPSYLLKPVSVDATNWKPILIGSGYYTEAQLK